MNIQIQISDSGAVTSSADNGEGTSGGLTTPGAAGNASDGGGPKASLTGGDNSSSSAGSDTTDIGGPPDWLSEAIGKEGQGGGDTASAFVSGSGGGQDAGTAPSFE